MANVTLTIGGRAFTLACADGEEGHVARLGRLIDEKAAASGAAGQTETRMLLFAALMMADELDDLRTRSTAPATPAPALTPAEIPSDVAERLTRIATITENIASLLESDATSA